MRQVVCSIAAVVALIGCKKGDNLPATVVAGMGGVATAGTGVAGAIAGGSGGATGATTGIPGPMAGCEAADKSVTGSAAHAQVLELLSDPANPSPCGFVGSCHGGSTVKAKLNFMGVTDLRATLVGKMACEAPNIPLVDGKGGQAALSNSWVWLKLTAPAMGLDVIGQAAWGTPGSCQQMMPGTYGQRMPFGDDDTKYLEDDRLAKIRNWICAGAPGP